MSSPILTLTSSSNANILRTLPYMNSRTFRDPSFSSYLNGAEGTFVVKLRSTSAAFSASIAIPHDRILPGEHRSEDAEIDVFDAERYFNESYGPKIDALQSRQLKKDDLDAMSVVKEQPQITTPSSRSESSWNSQTALLHSLLRNQQPRRGRKNNFLAAIGCSCSCRDKNSISIYNLNVKKCSGNQSGQQDKSSDDLVNKSGMRADTDVHFSFPVFNPKTSNQAARNKDDAPKHKPFQAFGSPVLDNRKYRFHPAGNLNLFAWNSIAAGTAQAATIPSISTEIPDDINSDASSDLFEIESLSMQASDGCVTPRAGYAPSEASIEWSVITASAADLSVLSDTEDVRSNAIETTPRPQKMEVHPKMPKRHSSILSGCRNHKAVNVAGSHRAYVEKAFLDNRRPPSLDKDNLPISTQETGIVSCLNHICCTLNE